MSINIPSGSPIGAHPCSESALIGDPVGGIRWPCSCNKSRVLPKRSESFLLAIRRRQEKPISAAADADAEDVFVARKKNLVREEIESKSPLTFRATSFPELAVGSKQIPE